MGKYQRLVAPLRDWANIKCHTMEYNSSAACLLHFRLMKAFFGLLMLNCTVFDEEHAVGVRLASMTQAHLIGVVFASMTRRQVGVPVRNVFRKDLFVARRSQYLRLLSVCLPTRASTEGL